MSGAVLNGERAARAAASFTLRGGPEVAANARAAIESLVPRIGKDVGVDLALLVSELVTNSYRHSGARGAGIDVQVWVHQEGVQCEVVDQGGGFSPVPASPEKRGEGGWGLQIVDKISARWGVRAGPPTHVWFELAR